MPDDQVTIDPEFGPPPSSAGQSRWLRLGAAAAAALILGWLLRSPTSGEPEAMEMPPLTTALTRESTLTTRPSPPSPSMTTATATTVYEIAGLAVPLGDAVPGFEDTITLAVSSGVREPGVAIVRWRSSQANPETIVSLPPRFSDERVWFAGLDAAGTWYALHDEYGVLSVRPVAAYSDWSPPRGEAVAVRVADLAWHDKEPGRLAWVSCPRMPGDPGTLNTLDVTNGFAEPDPVVSLPHACGGSGEAWISDWGDWGFVLGRHRVLTGETGFEEDYTWTVVLDPAGVELAQLEDNLGDAEMVAAGPEGVVITEEAIGGASSFLLALDGEQRTSVPGLAEGEWVDDVWWSPNGSRIALVPFSPQVDHRSIRVVDVASGEIVAEIDEPVSVAGQVRWSSDGRFLLYVRDGGGEGPAGAALVVYDTEVAAIAAEVSFPDRHGFGDIRSADLATASRLTPVQWGVALDDARRPGVYSVSMIADAGPLTRDRVEYLSGKLVWDATVIDLCSIAIRDEGDGFLHIGDIFQTTEGCGSNPTAMQEAFDEFGLPEKACLVVRSDGLDHEYCASLRRPWR